MHSFKSLSDRKIQTLLPIVLFSIILLASVRLVLDSFKSNQSNILRIYGKLRGQKNNNGVHVVVSPEDRLEEGCNEFEGKWVWDNETYPLYQEQSCPYLVNKTTCLKNGRSDSFYQNWRWQPYECNLPRFEPLKLLDMLRVKRMIFIGDSLQRGQFESMICLVQSVIPEAKKSLHRIPPMKIFKPEVWFADHVKEYNVTTAYRLALKICADWLESNINPLTKKLFIMTMSPTHLWRVLLEYIKPYITKLKDELMFLSVTCPPDLDFQGPGNGSQEVIIICFNESYPIQDPSYWSTGSNLEIMNILKQAIAELKIDVTLLNITQLSEYRKDAHTTVYGERKGKLLRKEQKADPKSFVDCIHWCLPGFPDTWNQILHAYLLKTFQNFA